MGIRVSLMAVMVLLGSGTAFSQPISDSFTYQGTLSDRGVPANGLYDVKFTVYDDEFGGFAVRDGILTVLNVQVTNGLFEAFVNFGVSGTIFDSNRTRWLELEVKPSSGFSFETLSPRQRITPAPLANYALRADHAEFAETSGTSLQEAYLNGGIITMDDAANEIEIHSSVGQRAGLILRSSSGGLRASMLHDSSDGGIFKVYSSANTMVGQLTTDTSAGGGGYLSLSRNNQLNTGVILEGNTAGSEAGRMRLFGPDRAIDFNTNGSGDSSVALPVNAINSNEILNETGVANRRDAAVFLSGMKETHEVISSVTVDCPSDGYVLLISSGSYWMVHTEGVESALYTGLTSSDSPIPIADRLLTFVESDLPSGTYARPSTNHDVFPVTQGTNTFYSIAEMSFDGDVVVVAPRLSGVFIPTAYGVVNRVSGQSVARDSSQVSGPLTQYDIVMEQNASIIANNDRLEREMQVMKAQMQQMIQDSKQSMDSQSQD